MKVQIVFFIPNNDYRNNYFFFTPLLVRECEYNSEDVKKVLDEEYSKIHPQNMQSMVFVVNSNLKKELSVENTPDHT